MRRTEKPGDTIVFRLASPPLVLAARVGDADAGLGRSATVIPRLAVVERASVEDIAVIRAGAFSRIRVTDDAGRTDR